MNKLIIPIIQSTFCVFLTFGLSSVNVYKGFYGCGFDQSICGRDEYCSDDCLFGTCRSVWDRQQTCFQLSDNQQQELHRIVSHLLLNNAAWDDLYTQCVLANLLVSVQDPTLSYDPQFCDVTDTPSRDELSSQLTQDVARLLQRYINDYDENAGVEAGRALFSPEDSYYDEHYGPEIANSYFGEEYDPDLYGSYYEREYLPSELGDNSLDMLLRGGNSLKYGWPYFDKRSDENDEYVKVHKYLKSHKRSPYLSAQPSYLSASPFYIDEYTDSLRDYDMPDFSYEYPYSNSLTDPDTLYYRKEINPELQRVRDYLSSHANPQKTDYFRQIFNTGSRYEVDDFSVRKPAMSIPDMDYLMYPEYDQSKLADLAEEYNDPELTAQEYLEMLEEMSPAELEALQIQLEDYLHEEGKDDEADYSLYDSLGVPGLPPADAEHTEHLTAEDMPLNEETGGSETETQNESETETESESDAYVDQSDVADAEDMENDNADEMNDALVYDANQETGNDLVEILSDNAPTQIEDALMQDYDLDSLYENLMGIDGDYDQISDDDLNLISDLVDGRINVYSLDDRSVDRLSQIVDTFLKKQILQELDEKELEYLHSPDTPLEESLPNLPNLPSDRESDFFGQPNLDPPKVMALTADINDIIENEKRAPQSHEEASAGHESGHHGSKESDLDFVNLDYAYITLNPKKVSEEGVDAVLRALEAALDLPTFTFTEPSINAAGQLSFRTQPNDKHLSSKVIADKASDLSSHLRNQTGHSIVSAGVGQIGQSAVSIDDIENRGAKYFLLTFSLCAFFALLVIAGIFAYIWRRHSLARRKLQAIAGDIPPSGGQSTQDYQDLCRQRMQTKASEKPEPLHAPVHVTTTKEVKATRGSQSSHSSTSSWSEEPAQTNMDISTGHIVLTYMEDHLANKARLDEEWEGLVSYEAEPNLTNVAEEAANARKNRYQDILPYDHSRVVLNAETNVSGSDYINASSITDHDPRNPAYIATQGPLPHTVADFWQMVWEQGCVVIVNLTNLAEDSTALCHRYWPEEGSDLYHIYEVHLVSEHIWCEDYLVRSFYLKNLQTNETRTVTQFHFTSWPDLGVPTNIKVLLDFRRKVNKSFRGRSCPIVIHCSDGCGRTGTYCLIDMVLSRMNKGAKEIDIAATLEHILDQRMRMVKTKAQFELALSCVAEEVTSILKALPQS